MLFRSANWSPRRWPSCTQLYFDAWLERRRHAAVEAPALGGIRCQLDRLDVVLWLVDLCRNRPRAHQVSREGPHQRARHRDAGQMRWVILDLGELPCLIDVSKLNPGPSGEDAERGQPRDVGSPCASARED